MTFSTDIPEASLPPLLWLVLLCVPMLLVVLVLRWLPRRTASLSGVRVGNPLLQGDAIPPHVPAGMQPLIHHTRVQAEPNMRALAAGLRHLPLARTAPVLRRFARSLDPELQLNAQSTLQEGQSAMQEAFIRLAERKEESPALLASWLESGLRLLDSPLTPASEHATVLSRLQEGMNPALQSLTHPRAVYTAAVVSLRVRQPAVAQALHARLPQGSPLHTKLAGLLAHTLAILTPPPPPERGGTYEVR